MALNLRIHLFECLDSDWCVCGRRASDHIHHVQRVPWCGECD